MRIKVVLTGAGYAQTANIPCDASETILQLKQKIKKRIAGVPENLDLMFDGGKVFEEDTLADLGIKEGDILTEDNGNAGAPPSGASIDLTVGDITQTSILSPSDSQNSGPPPSSSPSTPAPPSSEPLSSSSSEGTILLSNPPRPIEEVLVVVFDISDSMCATFLPLMSRLDASKVCFGAFIDKTLVYEYAHAIGLIYFGRNLYEKLPITREIGTFEAVFGEVIKTEGATNLYPAVDLAVKKINSYAAGLNTNVKKRILAFTDGGDNSGVPAYKIAKDVLEAGVVVDAVVIGGSDTDHYNLRSLAHCSGGMSVRIPQEEVSLSSVFEREEILTLSTRIKRDPAKPTLSIVEFGTYGELRHYPYVGVDLKEVSASVVKQTPTVVSKSVDIDALKNSTSAHGSGAAGKRILKEYADLKASGPAGTEAYIADGDIYSWKIFLRGLAKTPYEGGIWVVDVTFPKDYPFKPPKVLYLTDMYHCNISNGRVCLDILKDQWSPALTIGKVMLSLQSLMSDPNPFDALDAYKATLYRNNQKEYERLAREHTLKYAFETPDELRKTYNLSL